MPKILTKKSGLIIGVDEVGRGPLAGPISLAAFVAPENLKNKLIKILGGKIKDSKQFSSKRRKEIYREFLRLRSKTPRPNSGQVFFSVSHISNKIIDKKGISKATIIGIRKSLLLQSPKCKIRLDGLLKAPLEFKNQKTIIGGDSKDIFIACASIVAKVRRDRLMRRLAKKYPKYKFEIHKGYGTLLHRTLIKKYGFSPLHRKTFCRNLTKK
jgi:ribonuclease HII